MGTFTFDNLSVHYRDEGDGDPGGRGVSPRQGRREPPKAAVVFVHGFPFQLSMWDGQIPLALDAGRRAVAPDLPGFGRSDVPPERSAYSIDGYADLVAGLIADRHDQTDLLPTIAVPTLVVVGESDALIPLDVAEAMAKAIPDARFEVVPDAGHVANLENPGVFNRIFAEFLSTLPAKP